METHFSSRANQSLRRGGEIQDQTSDRKGQEREVSDVAEDIGQPEVLEVGDKRKRDIICRDKKKRRPEFLGQQLAHSAD